MDNIECGDQKPAGKQMFVSTIWMSHKRKTDEV